MDTLEDDYKAALDELTFNSKYIINALSKMAENNKQSAEVIARCIDDRMLKNPADQKLPLLYLKDSILKNVGSPYREAFSGNLFASFCAAFDQVDKETRDRMMKVFGTWKQFRLFDSALLDKINTRINSILKKYQKLSRKQNTYPMATPSVTSSFESIAPNYHFTTPTPTYSSPEVDISSLDEVGILGQIYKYLEPNANLAPDFLLSSKTMILERLMSTMQSLATQNIAPPQRISSLLDALQNLYSRKEAPSHSVNTNSSVMNPVITSTPNAANNLFAGVQPYGGVSNMGIVPNLYPQPVSDQSNQYLESPSFDKPKSLRRKNERVIDALYKSFNFQCTQCAARFNEQKIYDDHLDWHFRKNRRDKEKLRKQMTFRHWYYLREDWIKSTDTPMTVIPDEMKEVEIEEVLYTPADEDQPNCGVCDEVLEQTYDEETEDWMCVGAISVNGMIVHQKCAQDMIPQTEKRQAESDLYSDIRKVPRLDNTTPYV